MPRSRKSGDIIDWGAGIRDRWPAGEAAAIATADKFVATGMARYESDRSRADLATATARVSAHQAKHPVRPMCLRCPQLLTIDDIMVAIKTRTRPQGHEV